MLKIGFLYLLDGIGDRSIIHEFEMINNETTLKPNVLFFNLYIIYMYKKI